jgi:hypothetical protein
MQRLVNLKVTPLKRRVENLPMINYAIGSRLKNEFTLMNFCDAIKKDRLSTGLCLCPSRSILWTRKLEYYSSQMNIVQV